MSSSVINNDFRHSQTLAGPIYKLAIAVEMLWRKAESAIASGLAFRNPSPAIDMAFIDGASAHFTQQIKTPFGVRKIHEGSPIVVFLNDEFHRSNLPLARRANVQVTGFSSKRELLISEKNRDGDIIYNRLIDLEKRAIIAKTARGDVDRWERWN